MIILTIIRVVKEIVYIMSEDVTKEAKKRFNMSYSQIVDVVKLVGWILVSLTTIVNGVDYIYERYIAIPDLKHIVETDGTENFICEFQLQDAQLYIHPQMLLVKDEQIIQIINVEEFCEKTLLQYDVEEDGFVLEGIKWNDAVVCCSKIKDLMKGPHDDIQIRKAYLLKIVYKKLKSNKEEQAYYIVEYGETPYRVEEERIVERGQDAELSLENLETDIERIVSDCDAIVREK